MFAVRLPGRWSYKVGRGFAQICVGPDRVLEVRKYTLQKHETPQCLIHPHNAASSWQPSGRVRPREVMNIKARLTKLEQRSGSKELPDELIYRIVEPGRLDAGYDRVTGEAVREWRRREGETSGAFLERVKKEARQPGVMVTLVAFPPELTGEEQAS